MIQHFRFNSCDHFNFHAVCARIIATLFGFEIVMLLLCHFIAPLGSRIFAHAIRFKSVRIRL